MQAGETRVGKRVTGVILNSLTTGGGKGAKTVDILSPESRERSFHKGLIANKLRAMMAFRRVVAPEQV